jgi:hypothetical protein
LVGQATATVAAMTAKVAMPAVKTARPMRKNLSRNLLIVLLKIFFKQLIFSSF